MSSVAARLPGVFGALGRWWRSRERHSAADAVSRAEIDRVVQDYQRLAQAREEDHEHWRADIAELRAEIAELGRYLTESNQRFWDAVGYIRRLIAALRNHVPTTNCLTPRTTPTNTCKPALAFTGGAGFVLRSPETHRKRWQMKASYGGTQWTIPAQRAV